MDLSRFVIHLHAHSSILPQHLLHQEITTRVGHGAVHVRHEGNRKIAKKKQKNSLSKGPFIFLLFYFDSQELHFSKIRGWDGGGLFRTSTHPSLAEQGPTARWRVRSASLAIDELQHLTYFVRRRL